MRTIDADALLAEYDRVHVGEPGNARKLIENAPTIEERKTGKWVQVHGFVTPGGDPVWCCSECGKGVHVYGIEHGTYGADISNGQWKACPNCSALMEGEQT